MAAALEAGAGSACVSLGPCLERIVACEACPCCAVHFEHVSLCVLGARHTALTGEALSVYSAL